MTVVVEDTQTTTAAALEAPQNPLAPWHLRAGAFAVDVLPALAVVTTLAMVSFTVPARGVWWWACVSVIGVVILLTLVNRLLLPTVTGWSLGRGVFEPRQLSPNVRRWAAAAVLTAVAVCLGGAAVSYLVVYSRDRASDQTKAQIQAQGPKIVAQMLTYDPKSLRDDFARAQSLATDKYRGQLAAQQDVVQKGTPVINEYWPIDCSVQSATPDRATMLLFLQGRRGTAPDERYISATVRVAFAKGGDDHWRVDDLTVLTKPKPPGNGK